MQASEIDDETALTLALVASEEEHKRDSARRAIRDTIENDFLFALRLQEEENARQQQRTEPGSSNPQPNPTSNNRLSGILGTVFKARNDDRKGLRRAPQGIERRFRPRNPDESCCICHQQLPIIDNKMVWSQHPFWKTRVCRTHYEDGTERCASCERLKAIDDSWLQLEDDRQVCNECSKTSLIDNNSVQSLYDDVLQFFASLNLQLPSRPPLMLVDKHALNESVPLGGGHHGSEGFTRGMTFSEESWVVRRRVNRHGRFLDRDLGPLPAEQRQRHVTVIMVLNGLPRLLTGSILAHEVMHAYLKLRTDTRLPPQVEEGLCQLMGYLWIEKQTPQDPFEVKFCSFVAAQIREHTSPVYGDGFRAAFECFQSIGLVDLINHIKLTGQFPEQ